MSEPAALGFRVHSGWAAVVAVARDFTVLERYRLEIADPAMAGSRQPFHAAEALGEAAGQALLQRCRERSAELAGEGVKRAVQRLAERRYQVSDGAVLLGSGRALPPLAAILRSHALIHTAEGEFFRDVVREAGERRGVRMTGIVEKELWQRAALALALRESDLRSRIEAMRRALGPPWRQDEKLAAVAGWTVCDNFCHARS